MSRRVGVSSFWDEISGFPDFPNASCSGNKKPLWDFQTSDNEKYVARSRRHNKAIRICKTCVHQRECFMWGVKHGMQGVWGGQVLVPRGRSYFRCKYCSKPMIKSRYQKPPCGFRNCHSIDVCVGCHAHRAKLRKTA